MQNTRRSAKGKEKGEEMYLSPAGGRVSRATKDIDVKQHWRTKLLLQHGRRARRVWSSKDCKQDINTEGAIYFF
jgi:hypothetical protein